MITTTGLDFEAHNTPHALMEEKLMQDFPSHLISFFFKFYLLHITQFNINCYRHEIKFTAHALNAIVIIIRTDYVIVNLRYHLSLVFSTCIE